MKSNLILSTSETGKVEITFQPNELKMSFFDKMTLIRYAISGLESHRKEIFNEKEAKRKFEIKNPSNPILPIGFWNNPNRCDNKGL